MLYIIHCVLCVLCSGLCVISSLVQRQYFFVYEPKTFSEALSYCREKHTDLVSVQNQEEMRILNNMVDLSQMISAENKDVSLIYSFTSHCIFH